MESKDPGKYKYEGRRAQTALLIVSLVAGWVVAGAVDSTDSMYCRTALYHR
jgi:hypothetical protein